MLRSAVSGGYGEPNLCGVAADGGEKFDTTIVGISWAVISFQISTISLSLVFGRIGTFMAGRRYSG
jgi:hypothetical protein